MESCLNTCASSQASEHLVFLSLSTSVTLSEPERPGSRATWDLTHGNRAASRGSGWPLGVQEYPQESRVRTVSPAARLLQELPLALPDAVFSGHRSCSSFLWWPVTIASISSGRHLLCEASLLSVMSASLSVFPPHLVHWVCGCVPPWSVPCEQELYQLCPYHPRCDRWMELVRTWNMGELDG